jgi:hypothetical protein
MRKVSLAVVSALALMVAAGCTNADSAARARSSSEPSSPAAPTSSVPEAQGVGRGVSLWALFFTDLKRDQEIKIVWRMTGAGDLSMRATGPGGAIVTPVWGPEPHSGSSWQKPGDEWGTGWVFPSAGRWIVHATRSESGTADLALTIAP